MSQETGRKWFSPDISRGIACANKLDSFEGDPLTVSCPPEPMLFSELSKECDDNHSGISIGVWQVDLIAEYD